MGFFSKKKDKEVAQIVEEKSASMSAPKAVQFDGVDPEIVAAITAAIYCMMGASSNLVVRNIVRVNDTTPVWGRVSRRDVMSSRL